MHGAHISLRDKSVHCEAQCSKSLNQWHSTHAINLMVQEVQG